MEGLFCLIAISAFIKDMPAHVFFVFFHNLTPSPSPKRRWEQNRKNRVGKKR